MISDDEGVHVTFICPPGDSYHQRVGIDQLGRVGVDCVILKQKTINFVLEPSSLSAFITSKTHEGAQKH